MKTNEAFRIYLQDELLKRSRKNPSFSIRGFARQLDVEASSLAQILSSKRNLTDQMCLRIGEKLNLRPAKLHSLLSRRTVSSAEHFKQFQKLNEDQFSLIADWHYYAILELTQVDHFQPTVVWIAKTLGISSAATREAIERLKRHQYLKVDSNGKWIDCLKSTVNQGNEFTAAGFREHQKQLLNKAVEAIEVTPYKERVQSSMMLAGSRERVSEAKKRILNFIEELDEFMKSGETKDEVYTLMVSLFPISQIKSKSVEPKEAV